MGVQESIIDAELLIPISNACICGRQVHRRIQARDRYGGRLVPGLVDGEEKHGLKEDSQ